MMARKATLPLPTHSGSLFTWTGNKGVVEASTLGPQHTGRVWNDACDGGFNVRSPRTGKVITFAYAHAVGRSIGEIEAFVYRAIDGSNFEVHVLND